MATWFAQNSSVNIDSVNQWNSAANGSGSWLTWASLDPSDILVANGKTSITINVNTTCATLTTAATGGTAGGGFILADGVTLTASLLTGTTNVVTFSANAPAVANVIGNHSATGSQFRRCILHSGSGTLNITGNLVGGIFNEMIAVEVTGSGIINITGNLSSFIGASDPGGHAVRLTGSGTVNITGNVTSTGSITAAVSKTGTGTIVVTGNVTGSAAGSVGCGILSTTTSAIKVIGILTADTAAPAVSSTGTVFVYGNQVAASNGRLAVYASTVLIDASIELQHTYRIDVSGSAGTARTLYTGGTNLGQPVIADVRSGTAYGASSEYTGTLAVPSPTLVAVGVATDNTVGSYSASGASAADIADAVWDEARSGHVGAGTFGAVTEWAGQLGANAPAGWINTAAFAAGATIPRVTLADTTTDLTNLPAIPANWLTAAGISADAGAELAALVETYIVNEGDATAVIQAIADKIAQDWIAGDASPVAVATAVWSVATRTITGGSLTTSPPTAGQVADAVWDEARSGHVTAGTFGEKVTAELDSDALTKIDDILTDTGTTLPAQIAGIEGGGGSSVNVLPAVGIVANRSPGVTLLPVVGETISQSITLYQTDGTTPVDLGGKTLKIIFETLSGADVAVVLNNDITVSGADDNVVTFAYPSAVTASERVLKFALRDAAAPLTMYLQGVCSVVAAPKVDA
jgi:hypothetical protein